jgi:ABC-type amino acid transport substrate-binding protein
MRVGYNSDFRPFAWEEGEEARGDLIDICRDLFYKIGLPVDFVALGLAAGQLALQKGEIDALAGVAISPDRKDQLVFSKPLIETGGAWFTLNDTEWPNDAELEDRGRKQLAVTTPAKGPLLAIIKSRFPNLKPVPCDDYTQALQLVLERTVDAAALNLHVGSHMIASRHPDRFRPTTTAFYKVALGLAILPGNSTEMIDSVNKLLPD